MKKFRDLSSKLNLFVQVSEVVVFLSCSLMTKFSKKLVSKCVYILILKNTEQSLVDLFMAEGGWNLIHTWLQDSINISNWDLVKEILSLLLITPVDVERLKLNNIPKLVKSLSRLEEVKGKIQKLLIIVYCINKRGLLILVFFVRGSRIISSIGS